MSPIRRPYRACRAAFVAAGLAALALAAAATPVLAHRLHTHLIKSDPAPNEALAASPRAIRLWFSEQVELPVTSIKVRDQRGEVVTHAPLTREAGGDKPPVIAVLSKPLTPGRYDVLWSTAARDGHPAKGSYWFIVKTAR